MRCLFALAVTVLALGAVGPALAQTRPWAGKSIVHDPQWQHRFLGSYGFLSGAEPKISDAELLLLRDVLELMKTDPAAASVMLQQQITDASSASLDFVIANLEFQNQNLEEAAAHYERAIEKFPDFRRAHKNLGLLRVQQGDFEKGVVHLSRALEFGDRDGRTYGLIGYCYINLENYLAAEQAYRNAILQEPDVRDWQLGLARSLLATEEHKEAVALFETLIAKTPDDPTLWMLQANAYLGLDEPRAAAVNLEAVRMMGKAQSSSLVLLGDIYMNAGMYELAKNAYLEVIRSDQGATQLSTAQRAAELLVRARSFEEAEEILASIDERYGDALARDDELEVLTLKAKVARAQGREKEAAQLLESIVKRDGTRGDALIELASHYQSRGEEERALLTIERAQNLEAFEYQARLAHAQFRVEARDYAKAAEVLRQAVQIKREPRVERFLARVEGAIRP
jgi:tetratricopeptide (TPR) repeat protein